MSVKTLQRTRVQRSQTAEEEFVEKTGYASLGSIVGTRIYAAPGMMPLIASWMVDHSKEFRITTETFARLWKICASKNPLWFSTATAVRLEKQSRGFAPGIHIFHATSGFSQIPDARAPESARDAYSAAIVDHPDREFLYLEPLWRSKDGVLTPTTGAEFKTLLQGQRTEILKMIPKLRRRRVLDGIIAVLDKVIECSLAALLIVFNVLLATLKILLGALLFVLLVAPGVLYPVRYLAERKELAALRRIGIIGRRRTEPLTFWEAAHTLANPLTTSSLDALALRWDPIIVFVVPELAQSFGDEVPLGLVAHWD